MTSQSQAMLSLNYKLQTSILKSQIKFIDLELRKLEGEQAKTQVSIIQVSPSSLFDLIEF